MNNLPGNYINSEENIYKEKNEELERLNQELERLNQEFKTLDQMKSNLLSNVSHELRTPLVAIKGYTDLILKEKIGPINSHQKKGLEISLKSIERLISLIDNLLNFSKMEMGFEKLKLTTFNLIEVAEEEVQLIKTRSDEKKITVTTDFPDYPVTIRGDRDKISQIFLNLLENAVKFNIYEGKIHVGISTSGKEWILIKVEDTGIGIPRNSINKIFERFYQVDGSHSRKYGGTGIGLSITSNIVHLHGGKISVNSLEGKGTYFTVALPILFQDDSLVKTYRKFSLKGMIEVYYQNKNRGDELKLLLEKNGFAVLMTSYQSEALYIAEKYEPELIIWGIETVDQETLDKLCFLKENKLTKNIPLMIISHMEGIEEKYQIKAEVFLSEPLDKESLIFVVEKYLSSPIYITGTRPSVLIISDKQYSDNYLTCSVTHSGLVPLFISIKENRLEEGLSYNPNIIILDILENNDYISQVIDIIGNKNIPVIILGEPDVSIIKKENFHFISRPCLLTDLEKKIQSFINRETLCFTPIPSEQTCLPVEQKSILVVDNEPEVIELIKMVLSSEDYKIKTAFSGKTALDIIEKEDFGIILLDIAMADLDGIEVCRRIKTNVRTRFIPVYMITALITDEIIERALEAGADGYLTKPFKINALLDIVVKNLGHNLKCYNQTAISC
ncbi:MAG TPA: hybrid sensor histidine kinase/response regulator [Candidatus Eremiobacteraeota bacterium]|nr:MAG: Alkaline phosphatase synthesis sensor protein PhoR [bacterium ADurb.Bin363]HPZ08685.1 hybrid sensor histidine kinase/response regulator [Candidatus Eremiobacteraeota bacterium]